MNGLGARIGGLAVARAVMQVLSLAWFVFAARVMTETEFGLVATGLALVVLLGSIGDLGLSKTVVRHIAPDPHMLGSTFRRAVVARSVSAWVLAAAAIGIVLAIRPTLSPWIVVSAAAIAWSGGITEIVFGSLRSVGRLRTEASIVIVERAAFALVAIPLVMRGAGAIAILFTYALTNSASAIYGIVQIRKMAAGDGVASHEPPLFDSEGRRTALVTMLVTLGFRTSTLLLVVFATAIDVGEFAIAQRAPEAMALLGIASAGPILAVARHAVAAGDHERATAVAVELAAILLLVMAPSISWFVMRPESAMQLAFGTNDGSAVHAFLPFLAIAASLWIVRMIGEAVLLAEERSGPYLVAVASGVVLNVALGATLLLRDAHVASAAIAALAAEVVVVGLVVRSLRSAPGVWSPLHAPGMFFVGTGLLVALTFGALPVLAEVAIIGLVSIGATVIGGGRLRKLDRADSVDAPLLALQST